MHEINIDSATNSLTNLKLLLEEYDLEFETNMDNQLDAFLLSRADAEFMSGLLQNGGD